MKVINNLTVYGNSSGFTPGDAKKHKPYVIENALGKTFMIVNQDDTGIRIYDKTHVHDSNHYYPLSNTGEGIMFKNSPTNQVTIDCDDQEYDIKFKIIEFDAAGEEVKIIKDFNLIQRIDGRTAVCVDAIISQSAPPTGYNVHKTVTKNTIASTSTEYDLSAIGYSEVIFIQNLGPDTIYINFDSAADDEDYPIPGGGGAVVPMEAVKVYVYCTFVQKVGIMGLR